jgi:hypothetical protein
MNLKPLIVLLTAAMLLLDTGRFHIYSHLNLLQDCVLQSWTVFYYMFAFLV